MKRLVCIAVLAALLPSPATPQGYDPNLFAGLRWRLIGPFRGGRTVGATGSPDCSPAGTQSGGRTYRG
jgi:hypothetical protein